MAFVALKNNNFGCVLYRALSRQHARRKKTPVLVSFLKQEQVVEQQQLIFHKGSTFPVTLCVNIKVQT